MKSGWNFVNFLVGIFSSNLVITQNQQMIDRHRRTKTIATKINATRFSQEIFTSREKPQQYMQQLLREACTAANINPERMNVNELSQIVTLIGIPLKNKLLHEAYLYGTYERVLHSVKTSTKIASIVNLEIKKISLSAVSAWMHKNINRIQFLDPLQRRKHQKTSEHTQSCEIKNTQSKLPIIKTNPVQVFTSEVSKVINIFSQMEKQRQNAGLEPVCLSDEEIDDRSQPVKQINYDGDFFEVNSRLVKLRLEAQRRIEKVIDAAKDDIKLKRKFEEALMRYQRVRTEANEKMGKCGAMKAQKRMIDKTKFDLKSLQSWREKTNQTELSKKYY